jgi:transcriptional regulator with XRE-family HTH domain
MPLTEFGKTIKKARIDANCTLVKMGLELGVSYGFLSELERGKRKINKEWVRRIYAFFEKRGIIVEDLDMLADISNGYINISNLPLKHQLLVATLAHMELSKEELDRLEEFKLILKNRNEKLR